MAVFYSLFQTSYKNIVIQKIIKPSDKETKEVIEAINDRDLTEIQCNLVSLIMATSSITLTKMVEELNKTID